jgi:lipid-A-disaccharide synthase
MATKNPEIQFVNALAANRKLAEVETAIAAIKQKGISLPQNFLTVHGETREALNAADAAAVTSGTATLETAIIGTPMAIVYKTSNLNYKLLRPLISVPHFGLINLIAQERLANEFIQEEFTPENLAQELSRLLKTETNEKMRTRLKEVVATLGEGAARNAAKAIIRTMNAGR